MSTDKISAEISDETYTRIIGLITEITASFSIPYRFYRRKKKALPKFGAMQLSHKHFSSTL